VLDLAKVEAGHLPVAREPALTGTVVATALALTLPAAEAHNVRLVDAHTGQTGNPAGMPYVGDEQRVRQILLIEQGRVVSAQTYRQAVTNDEV
jgi:hypothetical protein